jgi:hypothetical protein
MTREGVTQDSVMPHRVITVPTRSSPALGLSDVTTTSDVITGLVPVIPIKRSSARHSIGMAGTRPAMTWRVSSAAIHDFGDTDLLRTREKRWDGGVPGRG